MPAATVQQSLGLIRRSPLEREFERLYHRHVADVYRYAVYVLRDRAEAEDVTQSAFLNAYRALERGDRPHKPRSWLLTIVHNECKRYFRTKSRRPSQVALDEALTADVPPDGDVPTPEEIRRALGELSFNQRSALIMRELEGRSYAEIAETLDLSVSAVETLLFRARRALREQLEGELTCGAAELALSRQLDKRLSSGERASLRAHLRSCPDCARLARSQRAQRTALRGLGPVPLPGSLTGLFGGGGGTTGGLVAGGSALGGGVALKAATILVGGAVATAVGMSAAVAALSRDPAPSAVAPVRQAAAAAEQAAGAAAGATADWSVASSLFGTFGTRLLTDDVEADRAGSAPDERSTGPAAAGPGGGRSGAQGQEGAATPTAALPLPGPVQAPKLPVSTPEVSVPAPVVAVPTVRVPQPSVPPVPPAPAVPEVTTPPQPVAVPQVTAPPVTAPPVAQPPVPDTSVPPPPPLPPPPQPPKLP